MNTRQPDATAPAWALVDFNGVLGLQPEPDDWTGLAQAAGWGGTVTSFQQRFWAMRGPYDAGAITPEEFWARMDVRPSDRARAADIDAAMWLRTDARAITLLHLARDAGTRLALLSNAPEPVARRIEQAPWASVFEHHLFSCDLAVNKPDPRAYELSVTAMGLTSDQHACVTFIDDRHENVRTAAALGMSTHHYQGEPATIARALSLPPAERARPLPRALLALSYAGRPL